MFFQEILRYFVSTYKYRVSRSRFVFNLWWCWFCSRCIFVRSLCRHETLVKVFDPRSSCGLSLLFLDRCRREGLVRAHCFFGAVQFSLQTSRTFERVFGTLWGLWCSDNAGFYQFFRYLSSISGFCRALWSLRHSLGFRFWCLEVLKGFFLKSKRICILSWTSQFWSA